ncbi:phosphotransferase family protein [Actinomadura madurae]|uniref:phosphotransferase family protein n=1 Tax=Actinomadura madurae TaxID=1993 RepID=UPI0020D20331|nr:phosphotransferase family protein [Actinomadura madurae]MCQ0017265.1 phosphotransferase family protein [Actinomadura madurae]
MSALETALAGRLGAPVTGLRRLSGGASRETWSFDADGRPLILRRDPPAVLDPTAMAREAALLASAADAGVPVPRLAGHGDDLEGTAYLIMERLAGETIPRRLLRDDRFAAVRPGLARELGGILARLHAMAPVPGLPDDDPLTALTALYSTFEMRPAVELALRWLDDRRPPSSGRRTVVHGDFRNGNLMIGTGGVTGVLDWELAHLGDPAEDLGWLCVKAWRFGSPHPVGGFGPRDDLLAGYAAAGRHPAHPRGTPLVGGVRDAPLADPVPPPGRALPERLRPVDRVRRPGAAGLRAGTRPPPRDGPDGTGDRPRPPGERANT